MANAQALMNAAVAAAIAEHLDIQVAVAQAINVQVPSGGPLDPNND
jgi:hypothetical protein